MLAVSQGRMVCLSTPFGKRGFFHKEWTEGEGWERTKITASSARASARRFWTRNGVACRRSGFQSEYLCEFVDTVDQVFGYEDVMRAVSSTVTPLFPEGTCPLTSLELT